MREDNVAGMIGTSSASAASNTLSDTSEMLGGQSRKMYSYSLAQRREHAGQPLRWAA